MIKKRFLSFLLGLFLIGSMSLLAQEFEENFNTAKTMTEPPWISYVQGNANLGQEEAIVNLPISEYDILKTANGWVEASLTKGSYLWLGENTEIEFTYIEEGLVKIQLKSGVIYIQGKGTTVEVQAEQRGFSFTNTEGKAYRIEIRGNRVEGPHSLRFIDDFDNFVDERIEKINCSVGQGYLPDQLNEYQDELAEHGSWKYYRPYGRYVWIPRVAYGWRPYLDGTWIWFSGLGWVWISYESFGWCTYHFGRWFWHPTLGWCWIPSSCWGPGWVYWYPWGDYICWHPMGWYQDRYYWRHRNWTIIHRRSLGRRTITVIERDDLKRNITQNVKASQLIRNSEIKAQEALFSKAKSASSTIERTPTKMTSIRRPGVLTENRDGERIQFRKVEKRNPVYPSYPTGKTYQSRSKSRQAPYELSKSRNVAKSPQSSKYGSSKYTKPKIYQPPAKATKISKIKTKTKKK